MDGATPAFWQDKALEAMSSEEWEALCDGCGRCCLIKLEDEDSGDVVYTDIACVLFDDATCRCRDYAHRFSQVPDCVGVTPATARTISWLPHSCAYRRLAEGRGLAWWHPLVSGDPETVHLAGVSVQGETVPEQSVAEEDLADHVAAWPVIEDDLPDFRSK